LSPATIQYGNLAEWVAAGVTFLFFGATWVTISRDHKEKRQQQDERRYQEARLVTVSIVSRGPNLGAMVDVGNASRRPVEDFRITIRDTNGHILEPFIPLAFPSFPVKRERIPLSWSEGAFESSGAGNFVGTIEWSFRDDAQVRWTRGTNGVLNPVRERTHWYTPETEVTSPIPP
jgi:hypothetical protein